MGLWASLTAKINVGCGLIFPDLSLFQKKMPTSKTTVKKTTVLQASAHFHADVDAVCMGLERLSDTQPETNPRTGGPKFEWTRPILKPVGPRGPEMTKIYVAK